MALNDIDSEPVFGERLAMGDVDGDDKSDLSSVTMVQTIMICAILAPVTCTWDAHSNGVMTSNIELINAEWTFTELPGSGHGCGSWMSMRSHRRYSADIGLLRPAYRSGCGLNSYIRRTVDDPLGCAGVSIRGLEAAFRLGVSDAPVGDMNGDGHRFRSRRSLWRDRIHEHRSPFYSGHCLTCQGGLKVMRLYREYRFDGLDLN